jgi:NADH:ubiquinone oxidoreductase subunit 2 (subunit N)
MPITTFSLAISLLGLGGIPFTSGFVSKYILFMSAFQAGEPILAIAGILNSAFSVAYYVRVLQTMVTKPTEKIATQVTEAPLLMLIPMCVMTSLILLFGVWPAPIMSFASGAADALLQLRRYVEAIFPGS